MIHVISRVLCVLLAIVEVRVFTKYWLGHLRLYQKKKGFPIVWPHSTVLAMSEVLVLVFEGL